MLTSIIFVDPVVGFAVFNIQNPSYVFPEVNAMQSVCVVLATGSAQLSSDTLVNFQSISGSGTATGT